MRKLSLGHLTLLGEPPPQMVRIAAQAGFSGLSLSTGASALMRAAGFRLVDDAALRRETAQAMAETGLTLDLVEGPAVSKTADVKATRLALEIMRDLGGHCVNVFWWADTERERGGDYLAAYCEMGRELGMRIMVEFSPATPLRTLGDAIALTEEHPGLQIMLDALHLARGGGTPADVRRMDPALIGSCQIADGPKDWPGQEAYEVEMFHERQVPGEGELPLRELVAALPADMTVLAETPLRTRREQGMSALDRARLVYAGCRQVMD